MTNIKISIIIPVYNVEKYIHQCLDSVLNQSLREIEVICVDDESPDNCPQILDEYAQKDSRVKVIHKKNAGQGVARNTGFDCAKGKYVLFIDSDDWLENDVLDKLYKKIESDDADVVFFNGYRYIEKLNIKNVFYFADAYYAKFKERVFTPQEAGEILYKTSALLFKIYKRESLQKIGFHYTNHRCIEDHLAFFNLAKLKRMSVLNDFVYNYRIHKASCTFNIDKKFNDYFDNFYYCYNYLSRDEAYKEFFIYFLEYKITNFFSYYFIMKDLKSKAYFYKQMKKAFKFIDRNNPEIKKNEKYIYWKNYNQVLILPFILYLFIKKIVCTIQLFKAYKI